MNPLKSILNKYKKSVYQDGGTGLVRGGTQEVQNYQKMLNQKYGAGLAEDGAWGPKTQAAYEKFVTSQKTSAPKTTTSTSKPTSTAKPPIAAPKKQTATSGFNIPVFGKVSAEQMTKAAESAKKTAATPAAKPVAKAPVKSVAKSVAKPVTTAAPVQKKKESQDLFASYKYLLAEGKAAREAAKKKESSPAAKPAQMNPSNVRVPGFGMSVPEASKRAQEVKQQAQTTVKKQAAEPVKKTTPTTPRIPVFGEVPKGGMQSSKSTAKPAAKATKPAQKMNPNNVRIPGFGVSVPEAAKRFEDRRQLPQTGVMVDRGTNQAYVFGNKKSYSYPVLTGMNDDPNADENMYTVEQIDKLGKKAKVTPRGYYIMDKDYVSAQGKKEYQGNIRGLRPISAYGVPAPKAANTALHQTHDPAYRNQFYSQGPEQRRQSYGCTNAQGENICRTFRDVANKDTTLVIDSRLPSDKKLLQQARKRAGYKLGGMTSKSKLKQSYLNKYK